MPTSYSVPYGSSGFIPNRRLRKLARDLHEPLDDSRIAQIYHNLQAQLKFQNGYMEPVKGSETMCNDGNLNCVMTVLATLIGSSCVSEKRPLNNLKLVQSCNPEYFCQWDDTILVVSEAKGFTDSQCQCWVSLQFEIKSLIYIDRSSL